MNPAWVVSLRDDVTIASEPDGRLVVTSPYGKVSLRKLPPGFADVIRRFADGGEVLSRLQDAVRELDVKNAAARLSYYLQFLSKRGYLVISVKVGGKLLATLDPMAFRYDLPREQFVVGRCVLSRFAYLRTKNREAVLETPRAAARIVLHDERLAALIAMLAKPFDTAEFIEAGVPGISSEGVSQFLSLLDAAGMLVPVDESDTSAEESDPSLAAWEFHDLLFHSRSRDGRNDTPAGATFRFLGESDPPPAVAPSNCRARISILFRKTIPRWPGRDFPARFPAADRDRHRVRQCDRAGDSA